MEAARVQRIYDEIETYAIELAQDPVTLGPRYLNEVTSRCRHYLNAVTAILLELRRERHSLSQQLAREQTIYDVRKDDLLAHDERVRRLPNIADRTATVNVLLREQLGKISELTASLQDVDHVEKAVKLRHSELKATSTEIKLQRSLVRDEIDTGSFYGEETEARLSKKPGVTLEDGMDVSALEGLLQEARFEARASERPAPPPGEFDHLLAEVPLPEETPKTEPETPVSLPPVKAEPEPSLPPVEDEDASIRLFLSEGATLMGASAPEASTGPVEVTPGALSQADVDALLDQI